MQPGWTKAWADARSLVARTSSTDSSEVYRLREFMKGPAGMVKQRQVPIGVFWRN
jgi:hypothetical protein